MLKLMVTWMNIDQQGSQRLGEEVWWICWVWDSFPFFVVLCKSNYITKTAKTKSGTIAFEAILNISKLALPELLSC